MSRKKPRRILIICVCRERENEEEGMKLRMIINELQKKTQKLRHFVPVVLK